MEKKYYSSNTSVIPSGTLPQQVQPTYHSYHLKLQIIQRCHSESDQSSHECIWKHKYLQLHQQFNQLGQSLNMDLSKERLNNQEKQFELNILKATIQVKDSRLESLQKQVDQLKLANHQQSALLQQSQLYQNLQTQNNLINNSAFLNQQSYWVHQAQTNASQTYMSIPQERKSQVVQTVNKGGMYFQHHLNLPVAQRSSFGFYSPMTSTVSPAFQRILRNSDLSNFSNQNNDNHLYKQGTPDTQENSNNNIFLQTDGRDNFHMNNDEPNNELMNQYMNDIDEDNIEIKDDDNHLMYQTNKMNDQLIEYHDGDDCDDESLRSPTSVFVVPSKKPDNNPGLNATMNNTINNNNTTNVMRFSNMKPNQTYMNVNRQHIDDIMERRKIREIINKNANQLTFSRWYEIEIEKGEVYHKDGRFLLNEQNDQLYQIQSEIIEDLILRKDFRFENVEAQQDNQQKQQQIINPSILIQDSIFAESELKTPQRQSKIEPPLQKIQNSDLKNMKAKAIIDPGEESKMDQILENVEAIYSIDRHQSEVVQNHKKLDTEEGNDIDNFPFRHSYAYIKNLDIPEETSNTEFEPVLSSGYYDGGHTYRNNRDSMNRITEVDEEEEKLILSSQKSGQSIQDMQLQKTQKSKNELGKIQIQIRVTKFEQESEGDSLNGDNMNTDENNESYNEQDTKKHKEQFKEHMEAHNYGGSWKNLVESQVQESPNVILEEEKHNQIDNGDEDRIVQVSRGKSDINVEDVEESKIAYGKNRFNFKELNLLTELSSQSQVQLMKTPQNNELRICRTRTNTFRDSNLQNTEREHKYCYDSGYIRELNKSIVNINQKKSKQTSLNINVYGGPLSTKHSNGALSPGNILPESVRLQNVVSICDEPCDEKKDVEKDAVNKFGAYQMNTYNSKIKTVTKDKIFLSPAKFTFEEYKPDKQMTGLEQFQQYLGVNHNNRSNESYVEQIRSSSTGRKVVDSLIKTSISAKQFFEELRRPPSISLTNEQSFFDFIGAIAPENQKKKKATNYFEDFLIIGISQEALDSETLQFEGAFNRVDGIILPPQNLYKFSDNNQDLLNNENSERANVVKDFCFPDGVPIVKLDYDNNRDQQPTSVEDIIQDIFYGVKNWRESTFIFTLDSNEESIQSGQTGGDSYLLCMCVVFNEIKKRSSDGQLFIVEKAFCFMFQSSWFMDLHLLVLNALLCSLKYERFKFQQEESGEDQDENAMMSNHNYRREIQASISVPLVTEEMKSILQSYAEHRKTVVIDQDKEDIYPLSQTISISINNNSDEVSFTFPSTIQELNLIEHQWYCPTIFSLFHVQDFFSILTAILLERSLIFVSDSLTILSSAILGFKTLIKPFSWCYALVPVLPQPLLEILDTPQPILVGITRKDYSMNVGKILSEEEMSNKTWVFLDENRIKWGVYDEDLAHEKNRQQMMKWCGGLRKETEDYFAKFYVGSQGENGASASMLSRHSNGSETEYRSRTMQVGQLGGDDNSVVIVANEMQRNACRNINERIQTYFNKAILDKIKIKANFREKVEIGDISKDLVQNCKREDREFIKKFVQTQMFVTLIEDNYQKIIEKRFQTEFQSSSTFNERLAKTE